MEGVDHFLTAYENETNTSFSLRTSYTLGGTVMQRLNCRAGGKESWLERNKQGSRMPNSPSNVALDAPRQGVLANFHPTVR